MLTFGHEQLQLTAPGVVPQESGFLEELGKSALYSGVQSPINGLAQLTDQTTSALAGIFKARGTSILPQVQFMEAPAEAQFGTKNWYAQQLGGSLGVAADFFLLHKGLGGSGTGSGIAGGAAAEAPTLGSLGMIRQSAITGAIYGGIFTPVSATDGNFWQARLATAAIHGATFATLSSATIGLTQSGQFFKGSPRLASFLSNDMAAGTLSSIPAGLVNANLESLLRGHGLASATDTAKSIYSFAVVGGTLAVGNKVLGNISGNRNEVLARLDETPHEIAEIMKVKIPQMTEQQQALAQAKILHLERDNRGSMGHEKYKAKVELGDGSQQDAIVRASPRGWFATSRFRYEQAAYHLNKIIGFDNGFPTTALRIFEKDGKPARGWVQDASGKTFGETIEALAKERYGSSSNAAVSRLVKENPALRLQILEAYVERFLYGDTDPSAFNMVMHLHPKPRVQNIDLDMAFHGDPIPSLTSSPAYGVNHQLYNEFANQPLPESIQQKIKQFVRTYDSEVGRAKIMELGLKRSETNGLLSRARWFARNGVFPEVHTLLL